MKGHAPEEAFHVYFGTSKHELDTTTLTATLSMLSTVANEIDFRLNSNKRTGFVIRAVAPGSIEFSMAAFEMQMAGLVAANFGYVKDVLGVIVNYLNLRKFLKGEEPRSVEAKGDGNVVTNNEGVAFQAQNITVNLFKNCTVINDAVDGAFRTLEADERVKEFQITDKAKKPLLNVPRKEFGYFRFDKEKPIEKRREKVERTHLHVVRVVFEEKRRWEFYYQQIKIAAYITDEAFNAKVQAGEAFAKGDVLLVDLSIQQEYDAGACIFFNKSYTVTKVHGHTPRKEQIGLVAS